MRFLTLAFFLLAAPAFAAEPPVPVSPSVHTTDMTVTLLALDGRTPLRDISEVTKDDPQCDKCKPLTLGHAAAYALTANFEDERSLTGDKKLERGLLALRIRDDRAAVLTTDEIALIKQCIAKAFSPLIVARAFPLLNPNDVPHKP